jgi:isopentenyldiphosphate isomerase
MDFKWIDLSELQNHVALHPEKYTAWFKLLLVDHLSSIKKALKYESK